LVRVSALSSIPLRCSKYTTCLSTCSIM
jgi:hypothetical protein